MRKTSLIVFENGATGQLDWPIDVVKRGFDISVEDDLAVFSLELGEGDLKEVFKIIPCFSSLQDVPYQYQFSILSEGVNACLWQIGEGDCKFPDQHSDISGIGPEVDLFSLSESFSELSLRLVVASNNLDELLSSPYLLSISLSGDDEGSPLSTEGLKDVSISVPPFSQIEASAEIGKDICSPTSLAMLLSCYGYEVDPVTIAEKTHHAESNLYGVWPAAVYTASRYGSLGCLNVFPSWQEVEKVLQAGVPIIASIRYEEGELTGAAISKTKGHLIVIRGIEGDSALVSDPAAESVSAVERKYPLNELGNVWLKRTGLGYLLFSPQI